ncbi:MAG: VOC family protein [Mycobacteriales bacterium]
MATRLGSLLMDAAEPEQLAKFWAHLVGGDCRQIEPGHYAVAVPDSELALAFAYLPDAKQGQNRIHLDLASDSARDQRELVARAEAAGAEGLDIGQEGVPWVVLADAEGNELCVREPSRHYSGTGPIAAILVDAVDPSGLADFWQVATGWERVDNAPGSESLRAPSGRGSWLEFWPQIEAKTRRNRLDFGLESSAPADAGTLIALGATEADPGGAQMPRRAFADPDGNEFTLLATGRAAPR